MSVHPTCTGGYGEMDCRCLVSSDEPVLAVGDVVRVDVGTLPIVGFRAHGRLVELLSTTGQVLCYPRAPFGVPLLAEAPDA